MSGNQTVQATELGPPEAVPDKNLVAEGDTVAFQVQVSWSTSFWVNLGWRWVPDTTTNTSTLVGSCWKKTTCKVVVRERGHVEVDDVIIEGSIILDARSPVIEVADEAVRIRSVTGVLAAQPAGAGGSPTVDLEISVVGSSGSPLPNRTVDITVDGVEGSGGHVAHTGTMPPGSPSSSSVNTGSSGVGTITYTADAFSGDVEIRGTSSGAAAALETITVRVPGLVALASAGNVEHIGGGAAWHPGRHWGTPAMVGAIIQLADTLNALYSRTLPVNDLSIPLGGKFDIAHDYLDTGYDHQHHRQGINADVSSSGSTTAPLTEGQQEFVESWWEDGHGAVYEHVPPDPPHLHLTLDT